MKKRKPNNLFSTEDRQLWKRVAETTTPLNLKRGKFLKDEMTKLMGEAGSPIHEANRPSPPTLSRGLKQPNYQPAKSSTYAPKLPHALIHHPIEEKVVKNLAKGRQVIDSRIDLHGMTQDRARFALMDFLQMAQRADHRIVLVITGKGNEGQGVLRRNVPEWLNLPTFKSLVNGFRFSHISHGGEGALYVRVRKLGHQQNHMSGVPIR